jgi:hypothetical protein
MPIRFLRKDGTIPWLTSVSRENPLPVEVRNNEGSPLPTEPSNIDILLVGDVPSVGSTAKDLLGSTDPETPTITQATPYKRFILYLFTPSAATVRVTLKGRATTTSGTPLNINWLTLYASGDISTAANSWYRVVLQASDGAPLGGDQYRIELTSTVSQTISFSLKGER